MHNSMAWRLSWARNQQGLTLIQLRERTGLAIGYISQLERGSKTNPSRKTLEKLARALNITVSFILGEGPEPGFADNSLINAVQTRRIAEALLFHLQKLTPTAREQLRAGKVEDRFRYAVNFLCEHFPHQFTTVTLACQLGLSLRGLNDVLVRDYQASREVVNQLCNLSGIPAAFFLFGKLEFHSAEDALHPQDIERFQKVIRIAVQRGIKPETLLELMPGGEQQAR